MDALFHPYPLAVVFSFSNKEVAEANAQMENLWLEVKTDTSNSNSSHMLLYVGIAVLAVLILLMNHSKKMRMAARKKCQWTLILSQDTRKKARTMTFLCYPNCSTCRKAKAFLDAHHLSYTLRDITLQTPTAEELKAWQSASGFPLRKFFNTSGVLYRSLGLKDRLSRMSEEEQRTLLASDGMLVKRPLLIDGARVFLGFREDAWAEALLP